MRSLPFTLISEGASPQPTGLRVSSGYPLTFFGLTENNELVDLGMITDGCLDFTECDNIVAIYYDFTEGKGKRPIVELILGHGVPL